MQGKQWSQQPLFISGNLSELIPKSHKLRKIDRVLRLGFLRELTSSFYSKKGRSSVDPETFFRMLIVKHLYGIDSDRQLCQEIQVNLAYRWFCRLSMEDTIPDHSSIGKIRNRLGKEIFEKAFHTILDQCREVGLIKGKQMVTDATLIKANASEKSIVKREDFSSKDFSGERLSLKTHVSKSDPEATSVGRPGYKGLYYKAHVSIDGGAARVITDCHVTTGARHECQVFQERVDHHINNLKLAPSEWLADRGYGHGPAYDFLRSKKITAYIPLRDNKLGQGKHAPSKDFKYDAREDVYICPMGEKLFPHKPTESFTRYRVTSGKCVQCPLREDCLKGSKRNHKRINRSKYQIEFDKLRARKDSKQFKMKLRQRSWKIEGIFGEAKTQHGLSRAHYRGLWKVQVQVYMTAMVQNLKRLADKGSSWLTGFKFLQMLAELSLHKRKIKLRQKLKLLLQE